MPCLCTAHWNETGNMKERKIMFLPLLQHVCANQPYISARQRLSALSFDDSSGQLQKKWKGCKISACLSLTTQLKACFNACTPLQDNYPFNQIVFIAKGKCNYSCLWWCGSNSLCSGLHCNPARNNDNWNVNVSSFVGEDNRRHKTLKVFVMMLWFHLDI